MSSTSSPHYWNNSIQMTHDLKSNVRFLKNDTIMRVYWCRSALKVVHYKKFALKESFLKKKMLKKKEVEKTFYNSFDFSKSVFSFVRFSHRG